MGNCLNTEESTASRAEFDGDVPVQDRDSNFLQTSTSKEFDHRATESTSISTGIKTPEVHRLPPSVRTSSGHRQVRISSTASSQHSTAGVAPLRLAPTMPHELKYGQSLSLKKDLEGAPQRGSVDTPISIVPAENANECDVLHAGVHPYPLVRSPPTEEWVAIQEQFDDDPDELLEHFQRNILHVSGSGSLSPSGSATAVFGTHMEISTPSRSAVDGRSRSTNSDDEKRYLSTWLEEQLHVRVRNVANPKRSDDPATTETIDLSTLTRVGSGHSIGSLRCVKRVHPTPPAAAVLRTRPSAQFVDPVPKSPRPQPRKSPQASRASSASGSSSSRSPQTVAGGGAKLFDPQTWASAAATAAREER